MFVTMTQTVFTLARRADNESRPFFILVHFPMWGGLNEERWELRYRSNDDDITIAAWGGKPETSEIHVIAEEYLERQGIPRATYPHGEQRMCGPGCRARWINVTHDNCPTDNRY